MSLIRRRRQNPLPTSSDRKRSGLVDFFVVLAIVAVAEGVTAFVSVPIKMALPLSLAFTLLTVGGPIFAIFRAASFDWTTKRALFALASGLILHGLCIFIMIKWRPTPTIFHLILFGGVQGAAQIGLLTWCLGIAALVATLIKDRNIIPIIAMFLAAFDVLMVLTPLGATQAVMKSHPQILTHVGMAVPQLSHRPTLSRVLPLGFIGPADLLFLGMFFIVLMRFGMKVKETMVWMIPVLLVYLAIVVLYGDTRIGPVQLNALPALVPIGSVVFFVNRKEWSLSKQEKTMTIVVAVISILIVVYGFSRATAKSKQAALLGPSRSVTVQESLRVANWLQPIS